MKLKPVWIVALLWLALPLRAVVHETGNLEQFLFGSEPACVYDNWISHVAENIANPGFNLYAPWDRQTPGFGSFVVPEDGQLLFWGNAIDAFLDGEHDTAQQILDTAGFPFQIVVFQDTASQKTYYLIRETLNQHFDDNGTDQTWDDEYGSFDYGWGIYIYDPGSPNPMIVTAPHPCDDFPSPMMAWEAFRRCNARWLMINGAGREVAYQGSSYSSNNNSLSDPSRYWGHPLNTVYQKAADLIRSDFGREEFSLQVHTYDSFRQGTQRDVQLSAGHGRYIPMLPIRDLSRRKLDVIHQTPYVVHPAGSFGNHGEVTVSDYYSVYYAQGPPVMYTNDGHNIQLNNNEDYPGSAQNQQMQYTTQELDIQIVNPFLHVEMGEFPQTFVQTEDDFKLFYGWDPAISSWDPTQLLTRFKAYYLTWIDNLATALPEMFELDDFEPPSNPENLYATVDWNSLKLGWNRSYSYDFESYEVHYSYIQNNQQYSGILDRDDDEDYGRQDYDYDTLPYSPFHDLSGIMTFKIRARDIHGNVSGFSNPVSLSYPSNKIQSFTLTSYTNRNYLTWSGAANSLTTLGYKIYRSTDGFMFELYDSWETNPQLSPPAQNYGNYSDYAIVPGTPYYYKIGRVFATGGEYLDYRVVKGSPILGYPLTVTRLSNGTTSQFSFGMHPFATSEIDPVIDQTYSSFPVNPFCLGSITGYFDEYLQRDMRPMFDPLTTLQTFLLAFSTSLNGESFRFSLPDSLMNAGFTFLLEDLDTHTWTDLSANAYVLTGAPYGMKLYRLIWGKTLPELSIPPGPELYAQTGQTINLAWELSIPVLVDHLELRLCGTEGDTVLFPNLPVGFTNVDFTVPADHPLSGVHFMVIAHLRDGSTMEATSAWQIHFYDSVYQISGPAGRSFLSFPTTSMYSTMMDIFGGECGFWTWTNSLGWQPQEEMIFDRPYLADFEQSYSVNLPNLPLTTVYVRDLAPGWNFIPNPHQQDHLLKDLLFREGETVFTAAELSSSGRLYPRFLVLRDQALELSDVLPRGGSVFIRLLSETPVELILDPSHHTGESCQIPRSWELTLRASQAPAAAEVILGSSIEATDAYDPRWDIPITGFPELPLPGVKLHLVTQEEDTPVQYYARYTGLYPDWDTVSRVWGLELDIPTLSPVTLSFSSSDLPVDYCIELTLGDSVIPLTTSETYTFQPLLTGITSGSIRVTSHAPALALDPVASLARVTAFPNPFSGSVTIDLPVATREKTRIEIFNLRGQKVTSLYEGVPDKALSLDWKGIDQSGRSCASGIYFLRISSGKHTRVIKLLHL